MKKFRKMLVLAIRLPVLQLVGKGVGYGIPLPEPSDVVHVARDNYDKFLNLCAESDFRQAVLEAGFSITENPPHFENSCVGVRRCEDCGLNGSGSSLVTALNAFRLEHREEWQQLVPAELQEWWLHRLQTECPHDVGTYTRGNPLIEYCNACHKPLQ